MPSTNANNNKLQPFEEVIDMLESARGLLDDEIQAVHSYNGANVSISLDTALVASTGISLAIVYIKRMNER